MPTRILLVDDHKLFREGVKLIISGEPDLLVAAEAASAREALPLVERIDFELLVVDVTLPGASGIALLHELKRQRRRVRSLVLSMHAEVDRVADAFIAGATAYVLKSDTPATLLLALRAAVQGERFLSPSVDAAAVRRLVLSSGGAGVVGPLDSLTTREREVFALIVRDYSTLEIADELGISTKTVESHREHLFRKLQVHSICELVRFAARHQLLEWESVEYGGGAE